MFLRAFAVQGSWNYRTLIGTGFAFALLPALRVIYRGDPAGLRDAVERHTRLFNSHPYLAPMALGAVAVLEADREDPAVIDRFKAAVRGSLGSLGDRLVWAGWRPVCVLFALALLLAGARWWAGVAAFLLVYNAGHVWLRWWSYRLGLNRAKDVGEALRGSPVASAQRPLAIAGAFLIGLLLPLAAVGGHFRATELLARDALAAPWLLAAAAGAIMGVRFGGAVRLPVVLALAAFAAVGLLLRITQ